MMRYATKKLIEKAIKEAAAIYVAELVIAGVGDVVIGKIQNRSVKHITKEQKKYGKGDTMTVWQNGQMYEVVM